MDNRLFYPVIISEYHDDGDYFVVTSPNIKGMVTQGNTMEEAVYWAEDAIATMLEDVTDYPTVQDPRDWDVPQNAKVVYISVNMERWLAKNSRSEPRTITLPHYLNQMAKKQRINVSEVTREALKKRLGL